MTTIEDFINQYGLVRRIDAFGYTEYLVENPDAPRKRGKMVLVTVDVPLKASRGEDKITTTIALIDTPNKRGINATVVLCQPSMGVIAAGSRGGASSGGKASPVHPGLIDWGLCGEMGAIEATQNLPVSFAEKTIDDGKLNTILVPRVSKVPSHSLRFTAADYGKGNALERAVLTPTCELMQIVALSRLTDEIFEYVSKIVASIKDGKAVIFGEFVDLWRITGILVDAVKPAKTEAVNGLPICVYDGPFASVSIGIPTLVSAEMACALHDMVIVEAGYSTDTGAQRWLDIACREYGTQWPPAAIVVAHASTWCDDPELAQRYPFHMQRLENLGIPAFPLINLWEGEDDQIPSLKITADELGFRAPIIDNLFRDNDETLIPQLDDFVDALQNGSMPAEPHPHRGVVLTGNTKWVAKNAYGVPAECVIYKPGFTEFVSEVMELRQGTGTSLDNLTFVAIKSLATMTDNDCTPEEERIVTLKKVEVHVGAGLVHVNLTTSLTIPMPRIV